MTSFLQKLLSNVFYYLPWRIPIKRPRDDLIENQEGNDVEVSPPKKQKIIKGSTSSKILREINQPLITTVRAHTNPPGLKIKIAEEAFLPRSYKATKNSMPASWRQSSSLEDNGRQRKQMSTPRMSVRQMNDTLESIDLTKEEEEEKVNGNDDRQFVDLTSPQPKTSNFLSLQRPMQISPVVDLTSDQENEFSSQDKTSSERIETLRRGRHSFPASHPSSRIRQLSLTRDRSGRDSMIRSKPVETVDLTSSSSSPRQKKNPRQSVSQSSVDLQEWTDYGRVLGSMLDGKIPASPPLPSPPLAETIDLTLEDDSPNLREASNQSIKQKSMQSISFTKPSTSNDTVSSSTRSGVTKEITRVNSFQNKINEIPFSHQQWVEKLLKDYKDTYTEFTTTRDNFALEARKWNEVNSKNVTNYIEDKLKRHLTLTEALLPQPVKEPYPSIVVPLPELTPEIELKVRKAFVRQPENEVLIDKFRLSITRRDIHTLYNLNWLNDEVINFYMQLLEERSQKLDNYPSVHTFSTFFYTGLQKKGHDGMKRWTKKVNIFEKDIIIVPIHLHVHWCLLAVDLKKKEMNYYDSMGHDNNDCLTHMKNYLMAEHKVKEGKELDMSDWKIENVKNIPQQMNGSDCGVFALTYAEFSSRRAPFSFDQSKMQYFRKKICYEIITGQLL